MRASAAADGGGGWVGGVWGCGVVPLLVSGGVGGLCGRRGVWWGFRLGWRVWGGWSFGEVGCWGWWGCWMWRCRWWRRGLLADRGVVLGGDREELVGGVGCVGAWWSWVRVLWVVLLVVGGWCLCFRGRVRSGRGWVGVVGFSAVFAGELVCGVGLDGLLGWSVEGCVVCWGGCAGALGGWMWCSRRCLR